MKRFTIGNSSHYFVGDLNRSVNKFRSLELISTMDYAEIAKKRIIEYVDAGLPIKPAIMCLIKGHEKQVIISQSLYVLFDKREERSVHCYSVNEEFEDAEEAVSFYNQLYSF